MDHPGPLVHSARDAALVVDVVGGEDPLDPHTRKVAQYRLAEALAWEPTPRPLEGVVVGIPEDEDYLMDVPNGEEVAAFRDAIDVIASLGATVRRVRTKVLIPGLTSTGSFYTIIRSAEVAAYQYGNLLSQPQNMSPAYLSRVATGVLMPGHAYMQAQRVRRLWCNQLLTVFDEVDVLIHPADNIAGLREGDDPPSDRTSSGSKTNLWNLSGAPAVALPTGFSSAERMPLSMQVAAAPERDEVALRVADAYQQVTDHHKARPRL
jgi:aspartyl-tRNA(Asn)/glutamyl-tRNA(Gln) amidotransferase subunit A